MKVYPVAGKSCWDPAKGDLLPAEGRDVVDSTFWRRRLRDKDVTLTPPAATTTTDATEAATTAATDAEPVATEATEATPAAATAATSDDATEVTE